MRQEIPGPIDPFLGTGEEMCDRENGVTSDVYASQPGVQGARLRHRIPIIWRCGRGRFLSRHGMALASLMLRFGLTAECFMVIGAPRDRI
jgi:hypothetical protein